MKPYDIINNIIEDTISNHLKDDYCLLYFPDHIRYNNETDHWHFMHDKHLIFGWGSQYKNNPNPNGPFYDDGFEPQHFLHYNKWIYGQEQDYKLRNHTSHNFYNHSWEPIYVELDKFFWDYIKLNDKERTSIVLHSELNSNDINLLEQSNIKNIHWFSHAYICSEFYFKYYQNLKMVSEYKIRPIKHKWLCANRLIREHRTALLEKLDLTQGCYSFMNPDPNGISYDGKVKNSSFDCHENHSAEININVLSPWNTSFLHVVSETVWQDRIHFTEKVFKPIVLHQPFVVVQAPGSLEYLRRYGFKTFSNWWDESYDNIQDPQERIDAIANIINEIGKKDIGKLEVLRMEMASVLEHNFRHFFENIPAIVLGELRDNIRLLN